MKKVVSIHLNNKMFQIEEDAYLCLNKALNSQWKKQELEAQVAEQFEHKLKSGKMAINYPDVVEVLYNLGISTADNHWSNSAMRGKKLYRLQKDKIIAGICSGLGEYFEIDPVIIRVLFVIALFLGTMGFWLYIFLWIIIPKSHENI